MATGPAYTREIGELRRAFKEKNLTLYLGAGVSVGNSLPTWEKLIAMMYFKAISAERMKGWRPFPNYLFAIAEWHLKHSDEPPEVVARKLRKYYPDSDTFLKKLRQTLYQPFVDVYDERIQTPQIGRIRSVNATLDAVAKLCSTRTKGVRSVITYNYDSLLERVLTPKLAKAIFTDDTSTTNKLPIFHVHGYVPMTGHGSDPDDIVFTEDQYHRTAQDVYSWSNLVQIQALSRSVGLMIGLSLTDRNMRRLMDAIAKSPVRSKNFALLQRPTYESPPGNELTDIHEKAIAYLNEFEEGGVKIADRSRRENEVLFGRPGVKSSNPMMSGGTKGPRYAREIDGILKEVHKLYLYEQKWVLRELGVTPIWYDNHKEIPNILKEIRTTS